MQDVSTGGGGSSSSDRCLQSGTFAPHFFRAFTDLNFCSFINLWATYPKYFTIIYCYVTCPHLLQSMGLTSVSSRRVVIKHESCIKTFLPSSAILTRH